MTGQQSARDVIESAMRSGQRVLNAEQAQRICSAYGIGTPAQGVAKSREEGRLIAERIGYPVVAKIDSPDILHKTDAGGLILGIDGGDALDAAYDSLVAMAADHCMWRT